MQWSELVKRETVDSTYERMELLLSQCRELGKLGVIGDCELRSIAEEYSASIGTSVRVVYMEGIANEIAHYLAKQFLQIRKEAIEIVQLG